MIYELTLSSRRGVLRSRCIMQISMHDYGRWGKTVLCAAGVDSVEARHFTACTLCFICSARPACYKQITFDDTGTTLAMRVMYKHAALDGCHKLPPSSATHLHPINALPSILMRYSYRDYYCLPSSPLLLMMSQCLLLCQSVLYY